MTISQSASTNAYVNDVLTEHKHKHKHKKNACAYAYVAAVLTSAQASYAYVYAYACVASEDRALLGFVWNFATFARFPFGQFSTENSYTWSGSFSFIKISVFMFRFSIQSI